MLDAGEVRRRAEQALAEVGPTRQKAKQKGLGSLRTWWLLGRRVPAVKSQINRLKHSEHAAERVNDWPSGLRSRQTEGSRGRRLRERNARKIVRPDIKRLDRRTRKLTRAITRTLDAAAAVDRRNSTR
jgi:hypothetical protein